MKAKINGRITEDITYMLNRYVFHYHWFLERRHLSSKLQYFLKIPLQESGINCGTFAIIARNFAINSFVYLFERFSEIIFVVHNVHHLIFQSFVFVQDLNSMGKITNVADKLFCTDADLWSVTEEVLMN